MNIVHFSLWCIVKSPLLIGCDVRNMDEETRTILTNVEAIAINQDPLGVQGNKRTSIYGAELWAGPLANGDTVIGLANMNTTDQVVELDWLYAGFANGSTYALRDLWAHQDLGVFKSYAPIIPGHSIQLLRASLVQM